MSIVKENIKKGFILLFVYSVITLCLFMASNRIQRLENVGSIILVQINK